MPDLSAPGGTVPSLARPGAWVEWVGYIPVLVHWGGFLGDGSDIRMVDPDEKWLNASGYQSLHIYPSRGDMDLRATVREQLEAAISPKKFDLKDVDEDGKDEARKLLADNEWLRRALEAGPVDPIRMPPKLRAVQTMPFA
jgi:hypothetical protein